MIRLIGDFIGHQMTGDQLENIVSHCSFESMKSEHQQQMAEDGKANSLPNRKFPSQFMRRGIVGDWRNHFSEEESMLFDQLYSNRLRTIGLTVAYDEEEAKRIWQKNGRIICQAKL